MKRNFLRDRKEKKQRSRKAHKTSKKGAKKEKQKKIKKFLKKGLTNKKRCAIIYKSLASVWEHSSVGRASALQAGGHRFEPYCSHHSGPVAQLVRAPACHAGGRGFEPHPGRHHNTALAVCLCSSVGRAGD